MLEHGSIRNFLKNALSSNAPYSLQTSLINPEAIYSLQRFEEQLNNPLLSLDWIRASLKNQVINLESDALWKTVQRRKLTFIDKSNLQKALQDGAAVVLEGLDIFDKKMNELLTELDDLFPCMLSNAEAFFSQKGNEAYEGHRDSDDVLVIQIEGTKHWYLHAPQQRRYFGNSPLTSQQMGPVLTELDLNPGDVLYVRGGVPHRCTTRNSYSLHISIDLCDRTPNIEQISHVANQAYNHASAKPSANVVEVVDQYVEILKNSAFVLQLQNATKDMQAETKRFRKKLGNSSAINIANRYKNN